MSLELEWYSNVRNGWTPLCDKCNENINRDNFFDNRNERGVYCEKCWNWVNLKKWHCTSCNQSGTRRSERKQQSFNCNCGGICIWQE